MAKDIHAFLSELYEQLNAVDDAIVALEAIARRRSLSTRPTKQPTPRANGKKQGKK